MQFLGHSGEHECACDWRHAGDSMDVTEWYKQLPVITRGYVTLCVLTTAGCALDVSTMCHDVHWAAELSGGTVLSCGVRQPVSSCFQEGLGEE